MATFLIWFSWITMFVGLAGTVLNAQQNKWGFVFWIVSNTCFIINNIVIKQYAQAAFFLVNLFFAIQGLVIWSKKEKKEKIKVHQ